MKMMLAALIVVLLSIFLLPFFNNQHLCKFVSQRLQLINNLRTQKFSNLSKLE